MFTCLSVYMGFVSGATCVQMYASVCVCVLLLVCSPSAAVPPAVDACSGDSIVSMSKDLPAALFLHVFIMLIQRKEEQGRREEGRREEGRGNDSSTNREKGVISPLLSPLRPRLFILTTSSVPSIPLYFLFFSSPHPLHLPLSYLPPLLL